MERVDLWERVDLTPPLSGSLVETGEKISIIAYFPKHPPEFAYVRQGKRGDEVRVTADKLSVDETQTFSFSPSPPEKKGRSPLKESAKTRIRQKLLEEKEKIGFEILFKKRTLYETFANEQTDRVKSESPATDSNHDARREVAQQQIANGEKRLWKIKLALVRLEIDRYGLCKNCGEPISLARLEAITFAEKCLACKEEGETDNKKKRLKKRR